MADKPQNWCQIADLKVFLQVNVLHVNKQTSVKALKKSGGTDPSREKLDAYGTDGQHFATDVSANFKVT